MIWRHRLLRGTICLAFTILSFLLLTRLYLHYREEHRQAIERLTLQKLIQIKWLQDQIQSHNVLIRNLQRQEGEQRERERASRRQTVLIPTSSDLYCLGSARKNRTCRARNLCYAVKTERYFILKGPSSFLFNVPEGRSGGGEEDLLDLTSLEDHNVFYFRLEEASSDFFHHKLDHLRVRHVDVRTNSTPIVRTPFAGNAATPLVNLTIVHGRTYLTKRFYPVNIMHVFHDDWLSLYSLRDYWPSVSDPYDEYYYFDDPPAKSQPSSEKGTTMNGAGLMHGLTVIDHYTALAYDVVYQWLGQLYRLEGLLGWGDGWKESLMSAEERKKSKERAREREKESQKQKEKKDDNEGLPEAYICYEDVVIGGRKDLAWYQYGYGKAQGPIANSTATGWKLREAAAYALRRLGHPIWEDEMQLEALRHVLAGPTRPKLPSLIRNNGACIAIFSRKSTRLILNEGELAARLTKEFGLPICWVRLEDASIPELIGVLRRATMAFGMHGSLLILAIFLPPGAVLIEGYPYGVPAENYTPYKTMANLQGMLLGYRSWMNTNASATVGHPDRLPGQGGIKHLEQAAQQFILNSTTIPLHPCCDNPHWLYRIFQDTRVNVTEVTELFWSALREMHGRLSDRIPPKEGAVREEEREATWQRKRDEA